MTDTDLVARARMGDETAWETLVRRHQDAAFRLAYLVCGAVDEAEDVAQEAFIRAFESLDRFDASRPLRPWLLQVVKNLAYNRQCSIRRYLNALERFARNEPEPVTTVVSCSSSAVPASMKKSFYASRSMTPAAPIPPPTHIVTRP